MEVVLLERIEKLGQMGDVVSVKNGYARNFLLPQGKALRATKGNLARFAEQRAQLEARNLELKQRGRGGRRQAGRSSLHRASAPRQRPAISTARSRRATSPTPPRRAASRRSASDRPRQAGQGARPAPVRVEPASGGRRHDQDQRGAVRGRGGDPGLRQVDRRTCARKRKRPRSSTFRPCSRMWASSTTTRPTRRRKRARPTRPTPRISRPKSRPDRLFAFRAAQHGA